MTDRLFRIAELNDRVRLGRDPEARVVMTATCLAVLAGNGGFVSEALAQAEILGAAARHDFGSDAIGERNSGEFIIRGHTLRFVIDYYDRTLEWGSEDPADPALTTRVLTFMLPKDD